MTASGWALILVFIAVLAALTKPIGMWLFALYEGRSTPLHRLLDYGSSGCPVQPTGAGCHGARRMKQPLRLQPPPSLRAGSVSGAESES